MRKSEIEMELQQRQMELMRFDWVNETLIGDDSLIRKQVKYLIHNIVFFSYNLFILNRLSNNLHFQFLENLNQDVNRFIRLDTLLQELATQYRAIEVEVAELITQQLATTPDVVILQSFNESVTNQQILFAQEFERVINSYHSDFFFGIYLFILYTHQ